MTVIAVAFGVLGCGRSAGSRIAASTRTSRSETAPRARAVPMVLDTGSPARLPTVQLRVHAGSREISLKGALYTADFSTRRVVALLGARYPVPWPRPAAIGGAADAEVAIDTGIVPDYVIVKSFEHLQPGSLVPSPAPTALFVCNRFSAPRCTVAHTDSGLRIVDLGRHLFAGDHVVVFCVWHVPPDERRGPNAPADAAASWLFRVTRTRPMEASGS